MATTVWCHRNQGKRRSVRTQASGLPRACKVLMTCACTTSPAYGTVERRRNMSRQPSGLYSFHSPSTRTACHCAVMGILGIHNPVALDGGRTSTYTYMLRRTEDRRSTNYASFTPAHHAKTHCPQERTDLGVRAWAQVQHALLAPTAHVFPTTIRLAHQVGFFSLPTRRSRKLGR